MISPLELPINSLSWLFGSAACFALGIKSYLAYRGSFNHLTKYIAWFSLIMSLALACFAIPPMFISDLDSLRYAWVIGEFLVYASLIPQAAILWSLVLRSHMSVYVPTVATGLIGLGAWLYAAPNLTLYRENGFIGYNEPLVSALAMALLLGGLFIPVGFHFLRATFRQTEFKGRLTTFVLGIVYIGIGVSTASHLIIIGEVASVASSLGNIIFFSVLLGAIAWPHQAKNKHPAVAAYGRPQN
jgi:hypothetical protein